VYAPELSMGMYTTEEIQDMGVKKPVETDFEEVNLDAMPVENPAEPAPQEEVKDDF
jgi:hypothetical protein